VVAEIVGIFTEPFTAAVKQRVQSRTTRQKWTLEQIQLAEDYIGNLSQGKVLGTTTPRIFRLTPHNARVVRDIVKALKKNEEWLNNAWEQSSS